MGQVDIEKRKRKCPKILVQIECQKRHKQFVKVSSVALEFLQFIS